MSFAKRLVVIGNGPDVLVARGIIPPGTSNEPGRGTVSIKLAVSEEACRSGVRLFQRLGAAIRARDIRAIARLRLYCPEIVERAPVLHTFLESLHSAGRRAEISRILGGLRPGRRFAAPYLAAAVAAAVQREGLSPTRAADAVAQRYGGELGNVSAKALLNAYSGIERELLDLYCGPQAVPGSVLTRSRWRPPQEEENDHAPRKDITVSKGKGSRGGSNGQATAPRPSGGHANAPVPNLPSTHTGRPSGGGRGNAPPR